ncbi:MAG: GNAT family N-acetyltransferase [Gammaproteobacteria bacterium]
MRYTNTYQERTVLDDGSRLLLRMVRPSDKAAFRDGLARLSDRTRYQRFMAPKTEFTESELAFLTEVDGDTHLAIVAGHERPGAEPEGIGVARIVRTDDDPHTAELGIVVADAWQHRGIGRLLLERIVAAASERGVRRIRAQVLADNRQVLGLLNDYIVESQVITDHGVLTAEFPIPEQNPTDVVDELLMLIRSVAQTVAITPELISELAAHPFDSALGLVNQVARKVSHPLLKNVDRKHVSELQDLHD